MLKIVNGDESARWCPDSLCRFASVYGLGGFARYPKSHKLSPSVLLALYLLRLYYTIFHVKSQAFSTDSPDNLNFHFLLIFFDFSAKNGLSGTCDLRGVHTVIIYGALAAWSRRL